MRSRGDCETIAMLELEDLGLMSFQLAEIEQEADDLVSAWLRAASEPGVRSPSGFFLAGVRSGAMPLGHGTAPSTEERRAQKVLRAERWVSQVGIFFDRPSEIEAELFDGPNSMLRDLRDDETLRKRMVKLWAQERPRGIEIEEQAEEHAARQREAYRLLKGGKK